MLSEEEKKAIERLEEQLNFWKKQNIKNSDCEIILNLMTKLQKENEEKNKQIDLMGEVIFRRFTAQLIIEYGIENKEQFIKLFEEKAKEKGE